MSYRTRHPFFHCPRLRVWEGGDNRNVWQLKSIPAGSSSSPLSPSVCDSRSSLFAVCRESFSGAARVFHQPDFIGHLYCCWVQQGWIWMLDALIKSVRSHLGGFVAEVGVSLFPFFLHWVGVCDEYLLDMYEWHWRFCVDTVHCKKYPIITTVGFSFPDTCC